MTQYSIIGKRVPRVDAKVKATGEARYTADLKLPGMLYGMLLRSPLPHARILNIDTSKAKRLPGVKAVITGKDTPGINYGLWRLHSEFLDELPLAIDKVRYIGDEVAAVAAIDEDTAREALDLIRVEYEELPAVFDIAEAIKEGAPQIHDRFERNINTTRRIAYGDVERGLKESDHIREDRFLTHSMTHSPMEPHVCIASFDLSGKLTVWTSTQVPYFVQCLLALTLGMREGDVRVIKPYVGGGFGGKAELFSLEPCSALLSKKTGRPVKIEYTREEELSATRRRHPMSVELRTGVKKDGTLVAREIKAILDGGAYSGWGPTTTMIVGLFAALPYRVPNYRYEGLRVLTNKVPGAPMRGHAAMQAVFAFESQLDMIADDLGVNPVELRLKNARQAGDEIPTVTRVPSCGLSECIEKVRQSTAFDEKRGKLPDGRGIGMGCYGFVSGQVFNLFNSRLPYSEAWVKLNEDGTANLFTLAADIGQGSDTALSQIVAEELGVNLEDVEIITSDTSITPSDMGSWASRVTVIAGNAAKAAAADAKRQLFEAIAGKLELKLHQQLESKEGRIYVKESPAKGISFAEAVATAQSAREGMPIIGRGIFSLKGRGQIGPTFSFGAQAAEVEVDKETGEVKVLKVTTAHDCGRAINPLSVEGQLDGSLHMSLGFTLSEELLIEKGKILNPSLLDYKILSASDMPEAESIVVETDDPVGPFGAKEAGEGLTVPTAPAIANAIYDAIGVRIKDLPITPEKILRALKEKKQKDK